MTIQTIIKKYLNDKDLYHKSDDILLDELAFNLEMMEEAKASIRQDGIQVNITRNEDKDPFFQKNRAVDVYQQALKNVQTIFKQLILSPSERHKMKIELMDKVDAFEQAFKD